MNEEIPEGEVQVSYGLATNPKNPNLCNVGLIMRDRDAEVEGHFDPPTAAAIGRELIRLAEEAKLGN